MTLEQYTKLTVELGQFLGLPYHEMSYGSAFKRFVFLCNVELSSLIGGDKYEELANIFMGRATNHYGYGKWASKLSYDQRQERLAEYIQKNWGLFLELLAEFCEPLIKGVAEKPEGGRNAAKA